MTLMPIYPRHSLEKIYMTLLNSVKQENCKIIVSGPLPSRGINIKPFNDTLWDLRTSFNDEDIDNHDSFAMASGKSPFDFFFPDKVNLKFSGTRKLVQISTGLAQYYPSNRIIVSDRGISCRIGQVSKREFEVRIFDR